MKHDALNGAIRIHELGFDFKVGAIRRDRFQVETEGSDPAGERLPQLVGRDDETDRIDTGDREAGHGHAQELAGLLFDERAAAVAGQERAVNLEHRSICPWSSVHQATMPPRVIVTPGLPLLSLTLARMPPKGKPAPV